METLDCYTSIIERPPGSVISSCCIPALGNLEREVVKTSAANEELELEYIYRVLSALSLTRVNLVGEFLPTFKTINVFTSSKRVISLLTKKKVPTGETSHRILIDLLRILTDGLYEKPVSILYIPKSKNFAHKRYVDIPFKQIVKGKTNAFGNR